jgi:hypothetical protein
MDYKEMNKGSYGYQNDNKGNSKEASKEKEANNEKENSNEKECKGAILDSRTLGECSNTCPPYFPHYKVPVVISEFTVQIDTESKIRLCEPAIEIKRIKKNVFLTQCRLIAGTKKVFISGFVRKNIEYATMDCCKNSAICGDIKHTTVHVPFQCVTELKNIREPHFQYNPTVEEITYFDEKNMGRSMKETDMYSQEYFNEKVFCELVHASIYEADIVHEDEKLQCLPVEHVFQNFIEKEVICLTIKLLQNQQVCEDKPPKYPHCDEKDKEYY